MIRLKGKFPSAIAVALFLAVLSMRLGFLNAQTSGTIYIRADGTVDPLAAPITREGNTYTLSGNISETIQIERDNIVIDGNGFTLQRFGEIYGFYLNDRTNVTIQHVNIRGFDNGIGLFRSSHVQILLNNITDNYNGIFLTLFSTDNTISGNNITDNDNFGIYIIGDSYGNLIYHNNFLGNGEDADCQLSNTWDDGWEGNYWSNYSGSDTDADGIGDSPYVIDASNQDRHPLMQTIPEFSHAVTLLFFIVPTLLTAIIRRRRHRQ